MAVSNTQPGKSSLAPNPKKLAAFQRLASIARTWPAGAPEPKLTSDEQRVLFRIARGNGRMVPLPEIQRERIGGGFMSQVTPRIHALKHQYGFDIRNHQEGEKSWYYIVFPEQEKPPLWKSPSERMAPQPAVTTSFQTSLDYEMGKAR